MMATYDLLAPHYDAVTGDCATEAAFVRGLIEQHHHRAVTMLDVACGTGGMAALLARDYQVSGLDISPGMLAIARGKLPADTSLYLADMTCFRLDTRFDAVVCAYQGVNHLLSFAAWERFFDRVAEHLNSNGVFVFDITTVGQLMATARAPRMTQQFGDNYLLIRVRAVGGTVFEWQIEVFELQPDRRYRLLEQTVRLRSFPLTRIREALAERFVNVEIMNDDGGPADGDHEDRIWFACTMPDPNLSPVRR
jgi:predicted TPR repeat methyltransferase